MDKEGIVNLIKEAFDEVSIYTGTAALRMIVERVIYDLSVFNPKIRDLNIPEDPRDMDFGLFSKNEAERFYFMFVDIIGALLGSEFKIALLRKIEGERNE